MTFAIDWQPLRLLLLLQLAIVLAAGSQLQVELPEFSKLPAAVSYATQRDTQLELPCATRSSSSSSVTQQLHCGYKQNGDRDFQFVSSSSSSGGNAWLQCTEDSLVIRLNQLRPNSELFLNRTQFVCKAVTAGDLALLSPPFRVRFAFIQWPVEASSLVDLEIFKGNPMQVECKPPAAQPPAEVLFTLNGKAVSQQANSANYKTVRLATGAVALVSNRTETRFNSTIIACIAHNPHTGENVTMPRRTRLIVKLGGRQLPPKVTFPPKPEVVEAYEGDKLAFTCITHSLPLSKVTFLRDNGNAHSRGTTVKGFPILLFNSLLPNDTANYNCQVYYQRRRKRLHNMRIIVKKRLAVDLSPAQLFVSSGNYTAAELTCTVTGGKGERPVWYSDGKRIRSDDFETFSISEDAASSGVSRLRLRRALRSLVQCAAGSEVNRDWPIKSAVLLISGDRLLPTAGANGVNTDHIQTTAGPSVDSQPRRSEAAVAKAEIRQLSPTSDATSLILQKNKSFQNVSCRNMSQGKAGEKYIFAKEGRPITGKSGYRVINSFLFILSKENSKDSAALTGNYSCVTKRASDGAVLFTRYTQVISPSAGSSSSSASAPSDSGSEPGSPSAGTGSGTSGSGTSGSGTGGSGTHELAGLHRCLPVKARIIPNNMAVNVSWQQLSPVQLQQLQQLTLIVMDTAQPGAAFTVLQLSRAELGTAPQHTVWYAARPQRQYQFRSECKLQGGAETLSGWSERVSFGHIVGPAPEIVQVPERLNQPLRWTFSAKSRWKVAGFTILVRNASGRYVTYSVSNAKARQFFFLDLLPGVQYQLRMFASFLQRRRSPDSEIKMMLLQLGSTRQQQGAPGGATTSARAGGMSRSLKLLLIVLGSLALLPLLAALVFLSICGFVRLRQRKRIPGSSDSWRNHITYATHLPSTGLSQDPYSKDGVKLAWLQQSQLSLHDAAARCDNLYRQHQQLLQGPYSTLHSQHYAEQTPMMLDYMSYQSPQPGHSSQRFASNGTLTKRQLAAQRQQQQQQRLNETDEESDSGDSPPDPSGRSQRDNDSLYSSFGNCHQPYAPGSQLQFATMSQQQQQQQQQQKQQKQRHRRRRRRRESEPSDASAAAQVEAADVAAAAAAAASATSTPLPHYRFNNGEIYDRPLNVAVPHTLQHAPHLQRSYSGAGRLVAAAPPGLGVAPPVLLRGIPQPPPPTEPPPPPTQPPLPLPPTPATMSRPLGLQAGDFNGYSLGQAPKSGFELPA